MRLCSDPQDRIFVLAALAEDFDTAQIGHGMTAQDLHFQTLLQVAPGSGQMVELAKHLLEVLELDVSTVLSEIPEYAGRVWNVTLAFSRRAINNQENHDGQLVYLAQDLLRVLGLEDHGDRWPIPNNYEDAKSLCSSVLEAQEHNAEASKLAAELAKLLGVGVVDDVPYASARASNGREQKFSNGSTRRAARRRNHPVKHRFVKEARMPPAEYVSKVVTLYG